MNRLENFFSDTTYQDINQLKVSDKECYYVDFEDEFKEQVNPFKHRNFLNKNAN